MKDWHRESCLKMNSNRCVQCIIFAIPKFNKRTEMLQLTINSMVKLMKDKVKNLGVIFDSRKLRLLHQMFS